MPLSWVDTKFIIHRVQHTPSTESTQDVLSFLHSHDYEGTAECSFSFWHVSLYNQPPSAGSPWELQDNVTSLHYHGCKLTNWWIESQHPERRPSTSSKYSSKIARTRRPCVSSNADDHGCQVHLQSLSITIVECISKLPQSWPPTVSPTTLNYCLEVQLQTRSIMASKFVPKLARLQPPSVSQKYLNHGLGEYPWIHSIVILGCTSNCSPPPPGDSPDIPCSDGSLYRYIDENTNWIHEF